MRPLRSARRCVLGQQPGHGPGCRLPDARSRPSRQGLIVGDALRRRPAAPGTRAVEQRWVARGSRLRPVRPLKKVGSRIKGVDIAVAARRRCGLERPALALAHRRASRGLGRVGLQPLPGLGPRRHPGQVSLVSPPGASSDTRGSGEVTLSTSWQSYGKVGDPATRIENVRGRCSWKASRARCINTSSPPAAGVARVAVKSSAS